MEMYLSLVDSAKISNKKRIKSSESQRHKAVKRLQRRGRGEEREMDQYEVRREEESAGRLYHSPAPVPPVP